MSELASQKFDTLIPSSVRSAINSLAEKPTNDDPTVRFFYEAVVNKINSAQRLEQQFGLSLEEASIHNDRFLQELADVIRERLPETSADFIAKFIFQAYQYTYWSQHDYQARLESPKLFTSSPDYIKLPNARAWQKQLDIDFADTDDMQSPNSFRQNWSKTMKEDNIPTTIAQRYAGIKAVLATHFGDRPFTVADIGCSTGIGLKALRTNSEFEPLIHDGTEGMVSSLMDRRINLDHGIGIDLQDFSKSHARLLALACRYTPSEFYRIAEDLAQEVAINSKGNGVEFRQGNFLTQAEEVLPEKVDAIIMSTVLYQLKDQRDRWQFVSNTLSHLNDGGIVIIQDFAIKDSNNPDNPLGIKFGQPWNKYFTYVMPKNGHSITPDSKITDSMYAPQQVLVWAGGRCTSVDPAEDFNKFFSGDYSSSDNTALAH